MASRRCDSCGIDFPPDNVMKCRICEGPTRWLPYTTVTEGWEDKVSAAWGSQNDYTLSKEVEWRRDQLMAAGYTESQALFIAFDRSIDLRQAVAMAQNEKCGPHLAIKILT